jgi:hypothetical protein
MAEA